MSKMSNLAVVVAYAYEETLADGTTYWVSPQCVECGEVEHADNLLDLAISMEEHSCSYC